MIHKNLTPFFWGPRVTSRKPPQPELAVCVRGVWKLVPGQPLEVIADPMAQGFMSGDTFAADDIDQKGALLHSNDFAEWKLHADLLLKGTCHPPGGPATQCDVRFAVGNWSKTLRVVGQRVYRPGLLLGGKASEPLPFERMALSWQNAYGGAGYATNPVGRGFDGPELPTVEHPDAPVQKQGKNGVTPATFLPISPHWPQRAGKRGKKYDATWKKTRAPFYAEDFDWTSCQGAPADQWYDGYLRGDEEVLFEHLHPTAPQWRTRLPGLRIRAFVKTTDGVVREPEMHLDTLYADLDDGKLYLTWRGHAPIRELDMTDVGVVLIASEPLAEPPQPFAAYEAQLAAFEADPVGLKGAFPPGFLEVAAAVEAAQLAERNGEPMPDLAAVAAKLPPDCPFPPWFLAAVAGSDDPLGIKAAFPPGLLDGKLPGAAENLGQLVDPTKVGAALGGLPKVASDPQQAVSVLKAVAGLLPGAQAQTMAASVASLESAFASLSAGDGAGMLEKAMAAGAASAPPLPAAASVAKAMEQAKTMLDGGKAALAAAENPGGVAAAALEATSGKLATVPSLDAMVADALAPLDSLQLPELPPIPDVDADLAAQSAKLTADEAKLREKHGDHPMLGLFALGHRLIASAPRPADVAPDLSPLVTGLGNAHAALLAQGISATALGPLGKLLDKVKALVAKIPKKAAPKGEFALRDLRGADFRGRNLRGAGFARADLTGASFQGADLTGADFRGANLTGADLNSATLVGADFSRATLAKARMSDVVASGIVLQEADLAGADLSRADLREAKAEQARLPKAKLPHARLAGADLRFAQLVGVDLSDADLSDAKLSLAVIDVARADRASLQRAVLDMAQLTKCRLHGARLHGVQGSMTSFQGSDLTGADLRECRLQKPDFMKAVLDRADLRGAAMPQANFRDVRAIGLDGRDCDLGGAFATGTANFSQARFCGARAARSTWMDVELGGADLSRSHFPNAYFQGSKGDDVNFHAAVLTGACFRQAQLRRPNFAGADLASADFNRARLDDANFRSANCYDVKFLGAEAVRSDFHDAFVVGVQLDEPGTRSP